MVGCHHRLSGHKFEQTPGDSEGQGRIVKIVKDCAAVHRVTGSQGQT